MKIFLTLLFSGFILGLAHAQKLKPNSLQNNIFGLGEELTYKVTFLGMTAGKAITRVDNQHYKILGKLCYKIDVFGETSDWLSWVTHVKDNWGAYMDTTQIVTRAAYRNIHEGHYRKDEWVTFKHDSKKASVQVVDKKTGEYGPAKDYDLPENATDLVGGFIHLRFFDFDNAKKGDTLTIRGFLEDANYTLKILYHGKEVVKTKIGKIPSHVLIPIMPDNKLFDGANSIKIWISDDKNKIPVKMSAKMFVGHTGIELIGFRGLKNSIRVEF